ncbi:hypothetical protein ILYODFUR_031802 [Ilyodon furcidens]|uniref:Uncharacterized protein n=1 Tax=Ilyodon furcidens TaxID=33524 RepID=A0ABV0V7U0_9TELE
MKFELRGVMGEHVPISSSLQARGEVHPEKVASLTGQTARTPRGNLERPVNLPVMFLDCERKLEYPERTHA